MIFSGSRPKIVLSNSLNKNNIIFLYKDGHFNNIYIYSDCILGKHFSSK